MHASGTQASPQRLAGRFLLSSCPLVVYCCPYVPPEMPAGSYSGAIIKRKAGTLAAMPNGMAARVHHTSQGLQSQGIQQSAIENDGAGLHWSCVRERHMVRCSLTCSLTLMCVCKAHLLLRLPCLASR